LSSHDKKYIWKVREIEFLGLVMGSGGLKMQEEKVADVRVTRAEHSRRFLS